MVDSGGSVNRIGTVPLVPSLVRASGRSIDRSDAASFPRERFGRRATSTGERFESPALRRREWAALEWGAAGNRGTGFRDTRSSCVATVAASFIVTAAGCDNTRGAEYSSRFSERNGQPMSPCASRYAPFTGRCVSGVHCSSAFANGSPGFLTVRVSSSVAGHGHVRVGRYSPRIHGSSLRSPVPSDGHSASDG